MTVLFRPFRLDDEEQALRSDEELRKDNFTFLYGYEPDMAFAAWLELIERLQRGSSLGPNQVRATLLAADLDGEIVGRVSIRYSLNEWLAREGGHIGYGVVPAHRRKGIASAMLRHALVVARNEGVERILMICNEDNVGSAKVIEGCGGVLEGPGRSDAGIALRRYWI